ncbi:uroporphyrinogen-III C-methyltransferase [uncultured Cardiobacterium sp.]|uniref:uroporphyrinogen-III C-methyltransferase n=1 Tax=uncultured Cardiobacterium sp. TaxID=417619 RepID=UPI00261FF9D6|nr:uroporphyrinogen-III C-methyltransferase [uncultured Cardiobacterium sp.]
MTDPNQTENQQDAHPVAQDIPGKHQAPQSGSGRGLAFLSLVVSVAIAGGGTFALNKITDHYNDAIAKLNLNLNDTAPKTYATISRVDDLEQQVAQLGQQTKNIDSAINTAVNAAVAANQVSDEQIAAIAAQHSISRDQAESLIKQELASFAQGETKIDLSKEIAAVQESEAAAKAAVRQIDEKRVLIEHALAQNSSSANPYPLLNALKMAKIAAGDGNYTAAKAYLDQAGETYTLFNLNNSPYAEYQNALTELRTEYGILAAKPAPAAEIDAIIATLPKWPYKNVNTLNLLAAPAKTGQTGWQDKLKGAGQNILEKTITVTAIDDAGLAWVQANDALQTILKENLRLDLAFARNALQLHDRVAYDAAAKQIYTQIERLFDTANSDVAAALATLDKLEAGDSKAPDIGVLIDQIEKAAKE